MRKVIMISLAIAIFIISAQGQGFLNLNFESAYNLPGNPPQPNGAPVATTNALPGWTAYDGDNALAEIYYVSNYFFGAASTVELEGGSVAIGGNFSIGLYFGASISQTGLVPGNAESLQFEASSDLSLEVTLGGQALSYSALSTGSDYTLYGANIPAGLNGQMEALAFTIEGPAQTVLDNIEFSPMTIPEPAEFALIGLGAILFAVHRRRCLTSQS